jgi:IS605 OrfB family transposase
VTVSLALSGLPASQRDGRLRAAISAVIALARERGCQAIVIEDLDFADAREQGRERHDGRPSRGPRGRSYRALVSGIPTARFRDRLVQMASNAGLAVIAVDPAYTSRWGTEHWLGRLRERISPVPASGHHAAAVVIGRRALGHRARRRAGVTGGSQRTSRRRAAPRAPAAHTRDQGRQAPPDPAAAVPTAQDRDGQTDTPARPGSPGPSGAAD